MDTKLNEALAKAMSVHWHEFKDEDGELDYLCKGCGELENGRHTKPNPAYDSSLSDAFELQACVIEKVGRWEYAEALTRIVISDRPLPPFGYYDLCRIATATAEQRARACARALGLEVG